MRIAYVWGLTALTGMFAGCGTVYEPLPGEPTARLRLVYSDPQLANGYELHKLDRCSAEAERVAFEGLTPKKVRVLGIPGRGDPGLAGGTELRIPAGRPVGVEMNSASFGGTKQTLCIVALRFDPQPNIDYEARFRWLDGGKRCRMDMQRLTASTPRRSDGRRSDQAVEWRAEPTARAVKTSGARKEFCATP